MVKFDIPGSYLHTETDEEVIMVLEGPIFELMVKLNPKLYRKYVTISRKVKSKTYLNMHKALYLLLRSALLFYKKFVNDLEVYVFVINPYDTCEANMEING